MTSKSQTLGQILSNLFMKLNWIWPNSVSSWCQKEFGIFLYNWYLWYKNKYSIWNNRYHKRKYYFGDKIVRSVDLSLQNTFHFCIALCHVAWNLLIHFIFTLILGIKSCKRHNLVCFQCQKVLECFYTTLVA